MSCCRSFLFYTSEDLVIIQLDGEKKIELLLGQLRQKNKGLKATEMVCSE